MTMHIEVSGLVKQYPLKAGLFCSKQGTPSCGKRYLLFDFQGTDPRYRWGVRMRKDYHGSLAPSGSGTGCRHVQVRRCGRRLFPSGRRVENGPIPNAVHLSGSLQFVKPQDAGSRHRYRTDPVPQELYSKGTGTQSSGTPGTRGAFPCGCKEIPP